jgi:hypothetical protein
MKVPVRYLQLLCLYVIESTLAADATEDGSINRAVAQTASSVSISIVRTSSAMDGGSILNRLRFSDRRQYTVSLDFPLDLATERVNYYDLHFRIFVTGEDPPRIEILEHGSAAEKRLTELLDALVATTRDSREKKNASSLVRFLKNRKQSFPAGRKWWDFTPWSFK